MKNCPKCGGELTLISKDYPGDKPLKEPYYYCGQCAWDSKKQKGFFTSIVKLLGGKVEISVDFHGAVVKAQKLGGYEVVCPACGDRVTVTDNDIKNAGVDVLGKPVGPPAFESVAHGLSYVNGWNEAVAAAESGNGDYINYRVKIAQVIAREEGWSFELTTTYSTSLRLSCGHSIPITLGEEAAVAKEPDRVEMFLKLGVKGEKSYRWMRYAFAGEDAPAKIGEKKAKEIVDFIQQLEAEKEKINQVSEKILAEVEKLQLFHVGFDRVVAESVSSNRDKDVQLLREAQLEQLDRIDEVLHRVAKRPGAR